MRPVQIQGASSPTSYREEQRLSPFLQFTAMTDHSSNYQRRINMAVSWSKIIPLDQLRAMLPRGRHHIGFIVFIAAIFYWISAKHSTFNASKIAAGTAWLLVVRIIVGTHVSQVVVCGHICFILWLSICDKRYQFSSHANIKIPFQNRSKSFKSRSI